MSLVPPLYMYTYGSRCARRCSHAEGPLPLPFSARASVGASGTIDRGEGGGKEDSTALLGLPLALAGPAKGRV
eukprot:364358-Chlamydomonas_euryale.AAC.5